ncbi:hypothetical protein BKA59DRAFT_77890 [Fusarium tricinctum]|uniref:Secreted protein n=1 Tax=Fusarium tricinctum TaxID=61284 RepID=A0A8K0WFP5_9HYPO|nr:hypothetical protein BKA59DRAFT_77890 [Fusarium tricinctum]
MRFSRTWTVLCWAALYTRRCVRVNEMGGTFYFMYDRYSGTTRNELLFVLKYSFSTCVDNDRLVPYGDCCAIF